MFVSWFSDQVQPLYHKNFTVVCDPLLMKSHEVLIVWEGTRWCANILSIGYSYYQVHIQCHLVSIVRIVMLHPSEYALSAPGWHILQGKEGPLHRGFTYHNFRAFNPLFSENNGVVLIVLVCVNSLSIFICCFIDLLIMLDYLIHRNRFWVCHKVSTERLQTRRNAAGVVRIFRFRLDLSLRQEPLRAEAGRTGPATLRLVKLFGVSIRGSSNHYQPSFWVGKPGKSLNFSSTDCISQ